MKAHLPKFLFRSALLAILGFPLATSFTGATDLANSPLAVSYTHLTLPTSDLV